MMNLQNHKLKRKIYYAPGLISATFLPILFLNLISFNKSHNIINYTVPTDTGSYSKLFNVKETLKEIKKKKNISFNLDDNQQINKKKLAVIRFEALRLKFTNNTKSIISIHLSDNIKYGEFISILNIMKEDDHKIYMEWKNIFYILNEEIIYPKEKYRNIRVINL